jgi:predicted acyltransferase
MRSLARIGVGLVVVGVVWAALAQMDSPGPSAGWTAGLFVVVAGFALLAPAALWGTWRALAGAAVVGAREAGRVGGELGKAYRDGRDGR